MPRQRFSRPIVFVGSVLIAYAGGAVLVAFNGWLPAALAVGNIVIYAAIYTPMKRISTMNTLVGAVCGALPPMVGWASASGQLDAGAWILAGILFVWQLPHFLALAWMYRDNYRRGGFAMLPISDSTGRVTAQTMVLTSLTLVPLCLAGVLYGVAGWWFGGASIVLGLWITAAGLRFLIARTDQNARRAFFVSIAYLPLLLLVMVIDRGPVSPTAAVRGGAVVAMPDRPEVAP